MGYQFYLMSVIFLKGMDAGDSLVLVLSTCSKLRLQRFEADPIFEQLEPPFGVSSAGLWICSWFVLGWVEGDFDVVP